MQVTNVNDVAQAYSRAFADVLLRVMRDEPLHAALDAVASSSDDLIREDLRTALSTENTDSTEFTGLVGRACHLPTAGPAAFHIVKHSGSYREAVERNILAGGDSAGRAILIGAIMARVHGIATANGVPLSWVLRLEDGFDVWQDCQAFEDLLA